MTLVSYVLDGKINFLCQKGKLKIKNSWYIVDGVINPSCNTCDLLVINMLYDGNVNTFCAHSCIFHLTHISIDPPASLGIGYAFAQTGIQSSYKS